MTFRNFGLLERLPQPMDPHDAADAAVEINRVGGEGLLRIDNRCPRCGGAVSWSSNGTARMPEWQMVDARGPHRCE